MFLSCVILVENLQILGSFFPKNIIFWCTKQAWKVETSELLLMQNRNS